MATRTAKPRPSETLARADSSVKRPAKAASKPAAKAPAQPLAKPAAKAARTRLATAAPEVDAYLAALPPTARKALRQVRQAVRAAAPLAHEVISYKMPALRQQGVLVFFAAFKNHIGFYPPVRGDAKLEKAAAPYAGEKGNLRFPLDAPMPLALIAALTRLRAAQDAEKAQLKPRARPRGAPA